MAKPMGHLSMCVTVLLLLIVVVTKASPRPKEVKCMDKRFKYCSKKQLYCPKSCPRSCVVNCASCQPVCKAPPPPPPPLPPPRRWRRSPPPPPRWWRHSPPHPRTPYNKSPPPPPTPTTSPPPPPTPTTSPSPPPSPVSTPPLPPLDPPPVSSTPQETESSLVLVAYCKNKDYPFCYKTKHTCPSACPDQCEVDCVTCSPVCNCNKPGAVCQDPRFIGGDGLTFYFHGKKDQDFCIVSDPNFHINAHFIGKRNQEMTRDFTWVQSLGILFNAHQIIVSAKKTQTWNTSDDRLSLSFDQEHIVLPVGEGAMWSPKSAPSVMITRTRETNGVVIEVERDFKIKATVVPITEKESRDHNYGVIDREDCFVHLDLRFKFYTLSAEVDGVLGQTYGSKYVSSVKMGVDMPFLGGDREFASSSLLSTDCGVCKFNGGHVDYSLLNSDFSDLNCASGIEGSGVVCKR